MELIATKVFQDLISSPEFKETIIEICMNLKPNIVVESDGDLVEIPEAVRVLNLPNKSTRLSAAATKGKLPFLQLAPRKRLVSLEVCRMYLEGKNQGAILNRWEEILKEREQK